MLAWITLFLFVAFGSALLARPMWFGRLGERKGFTFVGFLFLALGMTSPILIHPRQMMLDSGAGSDAFIGIWNLWWTGTALEQGLNPFVTDLLFAPQGTSLALHTHSVTYGVLSLPAQWILGSDPPQLFLVYNLVLWLSFALTGYLTYRLALAQSESRSGAVLAGLIFAFLNFRFANTVRLHVLATEWLVLLALTWQALLSRPSPRRLVLWMGSGLLLLYASLEYTAYAVPLLALVGASELWKRRTHKTTQTHSLRAWLQLGIPGFLISLALAWPFLSQLMVRQREGSIAFDPKLTEHFSADVVDFFLLNPRHPLWGRTFESLSAGFHGGDGGYGLSIGWVALGLFAWAGISLLRARRGRIWLLGFLFFAVLSLGPVLHVAGHRFESVVMPQTLVTRILPFLGASRTPIRYLAPAMLCLSVAIACAWGERQRRTQRVASRNLGRAEMLLGGLIMLESLAAPMALTPTPVPPIYRYVRSAAVGVSDPKEALLHLPPLNARENLLYQTVHERPLVENVESAVPQRSPSATALVDGPEIRALMTLGDQGAITRIGEPQRTGTVQGIRRYLNENRIGWIVVRPNGPGGSAAYETYCENLRFLLPREEHEEGGYTSFRF